MRPAPRRDEGRARPWRAVLPAGTAALLPVVLYLLAFRGVPIHNIGTDSAAYVVQVRAASLGTFDLMGARPGVGAAGAFLTGLGLIPVGLVPSILSIALVASLGIAAAAIARRIFALSEWALVPLGLIVAAWGGTARLGAGYLANLLSLLLFTVGVGLSLLRGPAAISPGVAIIFTAAAFAHPGLLPAFAAILVAWVAVSVPSIVRARDAGVHVMRSEPVVTSLAFLAAAAVAAIVLVGPLGLRTEDIADFTGVRTRFDERAAEIVRWIDPWITLPLLVAGVIVASRVRRDRELETASRLAVAWFAIIALGPLTSLLVELPGHRTLLLGVPVPVLMGVGIVLMGDRRSVPGKAGRRDLRAVVVALSIGLAVLMVWPFSVRAARQQFTLPSAGIVAAYLEDARLDRPVILVSDPEDQEGVLDWKRRQNAVRALAPDRVFLRVFVSLGDERQLLEGRQPKLRDDDPLFNDVAQRTWSAVRPVLRSDPVIVVVRPWVRPATWDRVVRSALLVAPDLAVVGGPAPTGPVVPVDAEAIGSVEAGARSLGTVLVLALLGGGWSAAASRRRGWDGSLVVGVAPAIGLAVLVPAGVAIGASGIDPGGAVGIALTCGLAIIGWTVALAVGASDRDGRT